MGTTHMAPRESRWSLIFLFLALTALAALMTPQQAHARNGYLTVWQGLYPDSTTDTTAGRGGCQVCHGPQNGTMNGYGRFIQIDFDNGTPIGTAITNAQGQDGDGQGDSNLTEIDANSQPGWTSGQNPLFDAGDGTPTGTSVDPLIIGVQEPLDPAAAEPNIAVAPTTLAFGIVDVGNSNTLTTTITNNGAAVLNVTALNLSGSNEFSLGTAPNTPFDVAPNGGTATVDVVYTPVDNGADTGSLTIASNDPDSPTVTVSLTGTGNVVVADACNFTVAPAALDFGNTDIGTSPTLSTTVTNNGTAACDITATVSGSVEFALASGSTITVAANGGTAAVTVSYTPADVGADVGNLNLTSDDVNNPQTVDVPLAGNGIQPQVDACDFSVAPTSLAFGPVTIGANSTLSTTVTNNGTAACNMTASVAAGEFTLASGATFTVAANGGTASVSVSYAPVDLGADTGNLSLVSDDATNPQTVNVPLSGSGVDVAACDGIIFTQAEWRPNGNGSLRVTGNGERDGVFELLAFDPAEIIATTNGNNGAFSFNISGRDLNAVPCRVRVLQPELLLCGEADVANAPDDCAPLEPFVPPVVPDPLTARGDTYATPVGNPITVTASRLSGVLYNDFGGVPPLTASLVSGPAAGSLAFDADGLGGFTYTPGDTMVDNSVDSFTYVAVDANGITSDPATVVLQTLSKQVDFKITMNYELGMHCTGFEFAYCCVLPPYNSIVAQVIKPAQGDPAANEGEDFVDGFPRLLTGDPNAGRDGLNRETVVRDWDADANQFQKYQLRYYHDAQPRQEGNTGKPNDTTLISNAEGNSLQYFNTVFDSAAPLAGNVLDYGPYNGYQNVIQGDGSFGGPTDNYANGWLNHFYIYIDPATGGPNLEGHGNTGLEGDKIRLGVAGQVEYPPNSGAGLQPLGPTGNGAFENLLTFSGDTGTVVYTQAKVLEDLPIMLTSPRIWEALGLPLTPFEDTIGFFADPGAVDEDAVRPYVAMKASLHEFPSGNAVTGSNGQPVIGFGTAPIDIPNCERCHSAPSINPDTGMPNVNSPNWNRQDASYPHGGPLNGTGLEAMTNLEMDFWMAYYDIVPGVDSTWYPRLKGAAINMLTLHDYDLGTSFTVNYPGTECRNAKCNKLTNESDIPQNTRLGAESVICQRCHADNVIANVKSGTLDAAGAFPIPPISEAIHNQHRNASEGGVIVFNDSLGRDGGCQGCHPAHRSDGVMDNYPITLGGDNANADNDNRLNPGGCFVGRDVHSNPMKDIDGAETPSHLNAVGDWLNTYVAQVGNEDRGIWCTNCHGQLGQELWRTEDCNDLIHGDCLVNPRGEPTLDAVAAAVGLSLQEAIDFLDPKVNGFDRTTDQTHAAWNPDISDANIATIEVDGGGNPVVTTDADGDISVNILSFCTTDDCVDRINNNKGDQGAWRYPANPFIDTVNNSGAAVPFSAATDGRDHWLSAGEPHCADCHAAPYTEQSGNFSAYPPFNYPAKASLMRYTRGHQDVTCQGCHESIHGLYPVTPTIDTTSYAQAAALNTDGTHGPIKCEACHTHVDDLGIPTWVVNLRYNDPTTPGQDNIPVAGSFDTAVGWMHTYTAESDPAQDVCQNCHGPEVPEIGEDDEDDEYLRHSMDNRVSRVAMDTAERAVNGGQVFGQTDGPQREALCTNCHGENELGDQECDGEWREHLIQGRVSQVVWEELSAPLGGCGW